MVNRGLNHQIAAFLLLVGGALKTRAKAALSGQLAFAVNNLLALGPANIAGGVNHSGPFRLDHVMRVRDYQ
jgi:hypothetical protein